MMNYPNHIIKKGEADAAIVTAIQNELNTKSCGPLTANGVFEDRTASAIKLFQTRHTDVAGTPLKADGQVGPVTWAILFSVESVAADNNAPSPLLSKVLEVAASQIGVTEVPPNSNRGPKVDEYLRSVGLNPEGHNYSWCAIFKWFCYLKKQQCTTKISYYCRNKKLRSNCSGIANSNFKFDFQCSTRTILGC